jgi:tetratricopeptide (TPR) repeat protein
MPTHFDLIISADTPSHSAELRLLDAHGVQFAYQHTDFKSIPLSHQLGLFNLRNYLQHYVEAGQAAASVAEIGVCIAEKVLGAEIFRLLWASAAQRTLRIQLPGASATDNHLAAALARVPWEMARASAAQPTLGERNLLVRVVHDMTAPDTEPLALCADECLRLLCVFAEARGSHPLAARLERQALHRLFTQDIYPQRRVVVDFLTHGVTRQRLRAQIEEQGGYHLVHWSGHGHLNLLELATPDGAQDRLTGEELLALFIDAGGLVPRLVFLSACHSGDILRIHDWQEFLAVVQGQTPDARQTPDADPRDIALEERPGYTGTAHALLQGGVASVVAMRYAVGDDYARDLAVAFYRALLAYAQPQRLAAALTTARKALLQAPQPAQQRYSAADHATPVLYGTEHPDLTPRAGRSPGLETRQPRLHAIAELSSATTLSSLANLFDDQGDVPQAITQQRRALALHAQLPDPGDRAISHNNLAEYLKRHGTPAALAESPRHQLAALIYRLVAGLGQDLQTSLGNYARGFRSAQAAGTPLLVPRVAELLADPAFQSLADWLRQRQVDVDEVQAAVDQTLEQVRQAALGQG